MKQKEETYAKLIPHESHESELHHFINFLAKLYSEALSFLPHLFQNSNPLQMIFNTINKLNYEKIDRPKIGDCLIIINKI